MAEPNSSTARLLPRTCARASAPGAELKAARPTPGLATVLVGEDPASQVYVRNKGKQAEVGMGASTIGCPRDDRGGLLAPIDKLNADKAVHGILVQLPLPKHIDTAQVMRPSIRPRMSTASTRNVGAGLGRPGAPLDFPVPCTPLGVSMLLQDALGVLPASMRW